MPVSVALIFGYEESGIMGAKSSPAATPITRCLAIHVQLICRLAISAFNICGIKALPKLHATQHPPRNGCQLRQENHIS